MQLSVLSEALNRRDVGAVDLHSETGERLRRHPVQEDRAGAALARIAADFGAGDAAEIANEMNQKLARLDLAVVAPPIDRNADGNLHGVTSGAGSHSESAER